MTTRIRDRRSLDEDETDTVTTAIAAPQPTTILGVDRVFASRGARLLAAAFNLTGDRHDAEDLMQDAFSLACAKPEVFEGRNENQAEYWLWRVMQRAWKDRLARKGSDTFSLPDHDLDAMVAEGPTPLAECERDWEMAVVYESLERLGPRHRLAMVMLARGMSEIESAQLAGVSRRTMREWRRDARRSMGLFGERLASGQICQSFETSLSAFADGEHGSGKQLRALEAHLQHCGHCRGVVAQIRRHSSTVAGVLPAVGIVQEPTTVDLGDLVHIGQHTADTITHHRGLGGLAPGLLGYLEEHWRLAVVAAAVPVLASAMVMQSLTSGSEPLTAERPAQAPATGAATPKAPVTSPRTSPSPTAAGPSSPATEEAKLRRAATARRNEVASAQNATPRRAPVTPRTTTRTPAKPVAATPARRSTPAIVPSAPPTVRRSVTPKPQSTPKPCRTTACAFAP